MKWSYFLLVFDVFRNNLGGWALEISKQYKDWQEGNKELSPLEEDHFNQLSALGFEFNVFAQPRSKRSWEENFDAFLEFRTKNGHSYVPPKYKGDVRLGKWADTQRDEYKLQCEGKPSRLSSGTYMTKEKFDKLQNAGFVWKPENSQRVWPEWTLFPTSDLPFDVAIFLRTFELMETRWCSWFPPFPSGCWVIWRLAWRTSTMTTRISWAPSLWCPLWWGTTTPFGTDLFDVSPTKYVETIEDAS